MGVHMPPSAMPIEASPKGGVPAPSTRPRAQERGKPPHNHKSRYQHMAECVGAGKRLAGKRNLTTAMRHPES